jgi:hypothetical protein
MTKRIFHYIVGDIHGCYTELLTLEAKLQHHAARHDARPLVVAVGDLVDRGPDSANVVAHFRAGLAAGSHVTLVGNHEQEMLRVLADLRPELFDNIGGPPRRLGPSLREAHASGKKLARWLSATEYTQYVRLNWLGQGGAAALASWGCDAHDPRSWRIPEDDLAFLVTRPLYWQSEHTVVTHALASADDLSVLRAADGTAEAWRHPGWDQAAQNAMWSRTTPAAPADPVRIHVSGHTPQARPQHLPRARALQIDTGCAYGRRLTAWCPETEEFFNAPSLQSAW